MKIYFTDSDLKYIVNRSCESWHVSSFWFQGESFDISPLNIKFFLGENFYQIKDVFSIATLLRIFVKNGGGKEGRDKLGDWDWHIHTTIYKIDS